uniref:Uncharacterized protein n=1 Tax=Rhizophora mucronata TaxID=61149 RepID=A0A2P2PU35_RHIMU
MRIHICLHEVQTRQELNRNGMEEYKQD